MMVTKIPKHDIKTDGNERVKQNLGVGAGFRVCKSQAEDLDVAGA